MIISKKGIFFHRPMLPLLGARSRSSHPASKCRLFEARPWIWTRHLRFASLLLAMATAATCSAARPPDLSKDPHLKMAKVFDGSGALLLALKELEAAQKSNESVGAIAAYQKALLDRRARAQKTLRDLEIALKNQVERHRYHRFYYQTGICYEILGQRDKAVLAYTKSIGLRPLPLSYVARAAFFLGTGQIRPAERDLEQAQKLETDYPRALFFQGILFAMKQEPKKALLLAQKLKRRRPAYSAVIEYYARHPAHAEGTLSGKAPDILEMGEKP